MASRSATIILRVHPRFGQKIRVLRAYGAAAVWAETEDGRLTILRVDWTDLGPARPALAVDGREIRLCPEAVRELARWVASRLAATRAEKKGSANRRKLGHRPALDPTVDHGGGLSEPKPAGRSQRRRRSAQARSGRRGADAAVVEQAGASGGGRPGGNAHGGER